MVKEYTIQEAAAELECSQQTVRVKCYRLGIKAGRKPTFTSRQIEQLKNVKVKKSFNNESLRAAYIAMYKNPLRDIETFCKAADKIIEYARGM